MPKAQENKPDTLRPYIFHGVDLQWRPGDKNAKAECPMCGRSEEHFGVCISGEKSGTFNCYGCPVMPGGGNQYKFLRWLHEVSEQATMEVDYHELAKSRGLQDLTTLIHWGICKSTLTGDWLVPGYSIEDGLNQLYRYTRTSKGARLLPTPTLGHHLFGAATRLFDADKPIAFICEGPWDAMVLWETLRQAKREECNVLGVPGCSTFSKAWLPLFTGRTVNLMYDNDHPRKHPKTGKAIAPAALHGMRRVARMLMAGSEPPSEVNFLRWGEKGYDLNRPSGFDIRDFLNASDF